jgi:PII-like signaling protein
MLQAGKAVKVTIYLSEGATHHGVPVYQSILDFLFYRGVAGVTALRGIAGFGADHHMHAAHLLEVSDKLPLKVEFIETREKVDSLLGKLQEMCGSGLIEIQETMVAKPASESKGAKRAPVPHLKIEGAAQMMRIYVNEGDKFRDKPLYKALVEAMRANDIAGVTVYRGILGYGEYRSASKETQHGPVMLSAIDTATKLRAFLCLVDEMVTEGLVVFSDVDIVKYAQDPADASKKSGAQ